MAKNFKSDNHFTIDDSLSLINRTGAFYIARELVNTFSSMARVRRWRLWGNTLSNNLLRKIYARLMLKELNTLQDRAVFLWPKDNGAAFTLYLDPLYVLRNQLSRQDIVLCHDIGPISHPHLYYPETTALYQKAYKKIVASQAGVVFVSNYSKEAFVNAFGSDFRFLKSIPLYLRSNLAQVSPQAISNIDKPFLLSVGALEHRKNHELTIQAFHEGNFYSQGYELIICGSRGDSVEKIKMLVAQTPGVKLLGYVSDAELSWLYQNAQLFVLPSQFEGFGMPALEAAAFGLPLVISKNNALNEAVNHLGEEVDHTSIEDIVRGIKKVLGYTSSKRAEIASKLIDCAKNASQEKFVSQWRDLISRNIS